MAAPILKREQAKGGLGTVLNMAREKLAGGEFNKATAAVGEGADDSMALAAQTLGAKLRALGSNGIAYDGVRLPTCAKSLQGCDSAEGYSGPIWAKGSNN